MIILSRPSASARQLHPWNDIIVDQNQASPRIPTGARHNSQDTVELLNLVRDGDRQAMDRLLQRHRDALRQIVRLRMDRKVQARVDASDIVQDVLFTAHRRMPDYLVRPRLPFFVWLRQIAKDRLIDAIREHRRAKRSVDREQPLRHTSGFSLANRSSVALPLDPHETPATAARKAEVRSDFLLALKALDTHDQQIIRLRHLEFCSNKEAAQKLGIQERTASMRHLRALRRLSCQLMKNGFRDAE